MRAFRLGGLLAAAVVGSVVVASGAAASPAGPHGSRVVGHVYVNDNTAPVNSVAGFDRHADGSLTAIPGSPFAVGGSGTGHPDASQGSLQLSADGRYLLAVDAGSNQISVLRIKHDGSLRAAAGSPVASGGVDPVSIGVHHDLVYVANAGPGTSAGDTNYTGFRLDHGGHLRAIPDSTYVLSNDSKPGQVLFNRDGTKVAGTRIATSKIDSFTVGHDGRLTPAAGSPYDAQAFSPAQGWGQLGAEFSPTDPNQLFVSDAHTAAGGAAFPGLVSSFLDGPDGTLTPVGAPVANDGGASCWVEISHDGTLPLRRQHRLRLGLQLLDRRRRQPHLPPEHRPRPDRRRRRGRTALPGRPHPLGRRVGHRRRHRLHRQRRHPHAARGDRRPRRRNPSGIVVN